MARYKLIKVGKPTKLADLLAKPASVGRKANPVVDELIVLVREAADPKNADAAFPWEFAPTKPATARQQATAAIKRAELKSGWPVYASMKDGVLWFSQARLTARGRRAK